MADMEDIIYNEPTILSSEDDATGRWHLPRAPTEGNGSYMSPDGSSTDSPAAHVEHVDHTSDEMDATPAAEDDTNARLPRELIISILQHVHRDSRTTLISCMQANQMFFHLGFRILYKNVSLRLRDVFRFERAILKWSIREVKPKENGADYRYVHFPFIRTMRLVVPGDGRDYGSGSMAGLPRSPGVDDVIYKGVELLGRLLQSMSQLRTFSIMSYNGHRLNTWDDYLGCPVSQLNTSASSTRIAGPSTTLLAHLIHCLPRGVKDLSIDLSELSRYKPMHDCDLCPAISSIAPRLEHLNLHLRSYCSNLLVREPGNTPGMFQLQSAVIRIHGFNARICTKGIPSHNPVHFSHLDFNSFTRQMKRLVDNGSMPRMQRFCIISKRRPPGGQIAHLDTKWTIYVRELVSDQTAAIPRIFIDSRTPTPGNTFITSARTTIRLPSGCAFLKPEYWAKEFVGKSGSIRRFVEGEAGWVCFAHGPHLPGLRKAEIKSAALDGYETRSPPPSLVEDFRKKHDKSCSLWTDEDTAGAKLLEPATWDGVFDMRVLDRLDALPPLAQAV